MQGDSFQTVLVTKAFTSEYLPFIFHTALAIIIILIIHLAAWWLGAKKQSPRKGIPYESGIIPTGTARLTFPVPFYLVAIFFIVFDVESAFIFAWATAWDALGFPGMIHITFFIIILLLGLVWLWLKGGLDWAPSAAGKKSYIDRKA
jgi:NADH-quinone oxidoreductase subunit A